MLSLKCMKNTLKNMINSLRRVIAKFTGIDEVIRLSKENRNISAFIAWKEILKDKKYLDERALARYGFKVHSQAEEDGIIHEVFRRIGSKYRTFLEIGVSNGLECNTLYLLRQGWKGAWIDGNMDYTAQIENIFSDYLNNGNLVFSCNMVTCENINDLYKELVPKNGLDLLSIDVDGNDYYLLQSITNLEASVIVLEYNPVFAPPIDWVMEYNSGHEWVVGSDNYGASLKSYERMLSDKGYVLVGCTINGNNAFFVRKHLVKGLFCEEFTAEFHYEPQRYWITNAFMSGHSFHNAKEKK